MTHSLLFRLCTPPQWNLNGHQTHHSETEVQTFIFNSKGLTEILHSPTFSKTFKNI